MNPWVMAGPRLLAVAVLLAAAALLPLAGCSREPAGPVAPTAQTIALGKQVYDANCAACHGAKLEGQPDWRTRRDDGHLPAPPHDPSGHTWHHPDQVLFEITKHGVQRFAGKDYASDMPAFEGRLSDEEIRAVLAWIKDSWPQDIRRKQAEIDARARQP